MWRCLLVGIEFYRCNTFKATRHIKKVLQIWIKSSLSFSSLFQIVAFYKLPSLEQTGRLPCAPAAVTGPRRPKPVIFRPLWLSIPTFARSYLSNTITKTAQNEFNIELQKFPDPHLLHLAWQAHPGPTARTRLSPSRTGTEHQHQPRLHQASCRAKASFGLPSRDEPQFDLSWQIPVRSNDPSLPRNVCIYGGCMWWRLQDGWPQLVACRFSALLCTLHWHWSGWLAAARQIWRERVRGQRALREEDGRMYTPPSVGVAHIIWENRGSSQSHYYAAVGGFENGSHREHMCRRPGLKYLILSTLSKHRCSYWHGF